MTSYRRSSAEQGQVETYPIIEECTKDQGVVRRYTKGRFLGKGGFAKCYEFTNLESKKAGAAKVIPKISLTKSRAKQKLMSEIKIHRSLRHQNVVGFEHFFEDQENVYILLEMCTNQTMNELIKRRKRLTELEVQCYLMQILNAVKYLHDHRVIHRDLKLGNLFLSDKMEIKLGDFGLATKLEFDGERKRTICGTPNYIAPEILEGKDSGHSYEVDVWSLGVIAYTLLIGKPPFETNDVKTTYRRIKMNEYSFPDGVPISSAARNMIKNILVTDPTKRLTVDEMFNHEFFKSSGSIPKLLPVSTLACPPSSSYIRQFQNTPSTSGGYRQSDNLVGRSQSPRRFENTTPLTGSVGLVSSASSTAYNPANVKSSQQVGLKERKDFVNTYRSGGGGVSTTGLLNSEYAQQKNSQQQGTSNTYGVKSDDYPQTHGSNNNVGTSSMTGSTSIQSKNVASNVVVSSAASSGVSSNIHNLSGGNNGATYQSYNSKQTTQNGQIQPTRNPIDKYSSSNNIHFQSSSSGSAATRARSEKMHTQPTSSLLQSYGIPLQLTGSGAGLGGGQSTLTQNLSGTNNLPASDSTLQAPDIWVKKWVDYSAKYGLGYLLNNGEAGIFFNDSTKIILDPETKIFEYYERRPEKAGLGVQHTLSTYPPELQKKVTLLLHFQQYLEGDEKPERKKDNTTPQGNADTGKIYVKKWLRTKHAILFIFSNKVAQVIFQDSTEIVLSDELRVLTYVNKKHERLSYPLNQLTQSSTNNEMTKRLRYTKDLLAHIYNNNNNNNNPTTSTNNPSTQISKNTYQQEPVGKDPSLDSKNNNSNSNYQSSSKPVLQQRENLHFSKNTSSVPQTTSQNQFSQPHSYPVTYNNYTQNENVNTLLSSKTGISQVKTITSGFGGAPMTNLSKKEILSNQVPGSNSGMSNSSVAHSLLKSNSSIGRINSANQGQSNSLANLNNNNNNNFNNYGMSSRKTEI